MTDETLYAVVRPDNSIGRTTLAEVEGFYNFEAEAAGAPMENVDGIPYGVCAEPGCAHEGYYPMRERAGLCADHFQEFMSRGEAAYSGLFPTAGKGT
jgi:hypothetical protein